MILNIRLKINFIIFLKENRNENRGQPFARAFTSHRRRLVLLVHPPQQVQLNHCLIKHRHVITFLSVRLAYNNRTINQKREKKENPQKKPTTLFRKKKAHALSPAPLRLAGTLLTRLADSVPPPTPPHGLPLFLNLKSSFLFSSKAFFYFLFFR